MNNENLSTTATNNNAHESMTDAAAALRDAIMILNHCDTMAGARSVTSLLETVIVDLEDTSKFN